MKLLEIINVMDIKEHYQLCSIMAYMVYAIYGSQFFDNKKVAGVSVNEHKPNVSNLKIQKMQSIFKI